MFVQSDGVHINSGSNSFRLPTNRGSSSQYMKSNGDGTSSWSAITPGGANTTISVTNGGQYTIAQISQNRAYNCDVTGRRTDNNSHHTVSLNSNLRSYFNIESANFSVYSNFNISGKIFTLARVHYSSSAYRISFTVNFTGTLELGRVCYDLTKGNSVSTSGFGVSVSGGTTYGSVGL